MNYSEAVNYKKSMKEPLMIDDKVSMSMFVVPERREDFSTYLKFAQQNFRNLTDAASQGFCSNGRFVVCGLYFDGANILYKIVDINT